MKRRTLLAIGAGSTSLSGCLTVRDIVPGRDTPQGTDDPCRSQISVYLAEHVSDGLAVSADEANLTSVPRFEETMRMAEEEYKQRKGNMSEYENDPLLASYTSSGSGDYPSESSQHFVEYNNVTYEVRIVDCA